MMRRKYPTVKRGDFLDLTDTGHLMWMRDHNPDGWNDATWRAFAARCSVSPDFKDRAREARRNGWARPHPTDDGWTPPRRLRVVDTIGRRRR